MKRTPLAALALVAALVVGCDDEVEPDFAPPESTSPAPTDPTTSTPPEPEKLSPEETVRAWVEARNITVQDGSSDAVYALSSDDCEACRNSVEPIRQLYIDGGHMETTGWRVKSAERRPDFSSSREVAAAVVFDKGVTYPEAGADPISYDKEKRILVFRLNKQDGVWLVAHFAYAS